MDDIQRKLALIDREHAGARDLHKQIVSTSPLIFVAVGLIIGILMQDILAWPIRSWLMLLVLCAISTIILFVVKKETYPPYVTAYSAFLCFICLGAIRLNSFYQPRPDDIRNFVADERKLATIRGLIITDPYINENRQWRFARFTYNDPDTSFYLKLKQVQTISGWDKVHGTIRVQVGEPVLDLGAGDSIQAYCWLDRFKGVTNPGQFDIAKYLERKNVFITASIDSRDGIKLLKSQTKGLFTKIKARLREAATQALLGDLSLEDRNRGLLQALLLGYRGDIDNATYEAFRKTGLLHFISLSGLHLGILAWIIWWLCKTAGLMKRTRAVICIIAIGVFLLIVPPRAPTLRAAIICWVFCISFFFRRRPNLLNSLSLAAIILLLIRPTGLFEAGWQLSFASVLGIILFTDQIESFLYEKITDNLWIEKILRKKLPYPIVPIVGSYLLRLLSIALGAWLGGVGFVLYHFYMINPFTFIWKLAMFPLVTLILAFGYLKIVLSFLLPTVAMVLGILVTGLADLLISIVKHIADLPMSYMLIGYVPPALIILYYSFILFAFFVYFQRPLLKKAICTAIVLVIIIFLGITKCQRTYRDNLILSCLDVGHGQAILAQLPGKANVLFDAGSMHKNDIGRRIVGPFLDYSGISKIEAIIISHNDVDHINGIPEVVEHCDVNGVYANDAFLTAAKKDSCGTAAFLDNVLRKKEKDFEINNIKDLNLNSAAKIKILWPTEQVCQNEELGDNDKSVVSLIEFAGRKVLLCSDIEQFAQQELIRIFPNLKANIVVVPHHGTGKVIESKFIKNLNPEILICSCSQRQYERQQAIARQYNARAFYTAIDGAIKVYIGKNGDLTTEVFAK